VVDQAETLDGIALDRLTVLADRGPVGLILVGRPEFIGTLVRSAPDHVCSAVTEYIAMEPLSAADAADFARHRLEAATGGAIPCDAAAAERIAAYSKGLPGVIERMCADSLKLAGLCRADRLTADAIDMIAIPSPTTSLPPSQKPYRPPAGFPATAAPPSAIHGATPGVPPHVGSMQAILAGLQDDIDPLVPTRPSQPRPSVGVPKHPARRPAPPSQPIHQTRSPAAPTAAPSPSRPGLLRSGMPWIGGIALGVAVAGFVATRSQEPGPAAPPLASERQHDSVGTLMSEVVRPANASVETPVGSKVQEAAEPLGPTQADKPVPIQAVAPLVAPAELTEDNATVAQSIPAGDIAEPASTEAILAEPVEAPAAVEAAPPAVVEPPIEAAATQGGQAVPEASAPEAVEPQPSVAEPAAIDPVDHDRQIAWYPGIEAPIETLAMMAVIPVPEPPPKLEPAPAPEAALPVERLPSPPRPAPTAALPAERLPSPSRPAPAAPTVSETALIERGNRLLSLGDIASARLFFETAANSGSARGALAAGKTHDPVFLRESGARGVAADPRRAADWYRRAAQLGDPSAATLLNRLGQH